MSSKITATERMLNLVIALLGASRGRSRQFIRQNINGYAKEARTRAEEATAGPAFERMFERDKEILREVGIPISSSTSFDDEDQEQVLYRIKPDDYRVPEIRLDEPAMMMLAVAANLWAEAAFGEAAQSALRKVATRAGLGWYDDDTTVQSRIRTVEPAFEPLWTALRENHTVHFDYRSAGSAETTSRMVQPWGLGSKYGEWYLAGLDVDKAALRKFRLSRIRSDVTVDAMATFDRPDGFSIKGILDSLGTGNPHTGLVQVPTGAARRLRSREGTIVTVPGSHVAAGAEDGTETLSITYREPELMAQDLASLGAQARVLAPESLKDSVVGMLTAAREASAPGNESVPAFGSLVPLAPTRRRDSRDRLVRLLSMVPFLVANPGISEVEICAEFGITAKELEADLDTLMVSGLPGYQHGDLMDVTSEHGQVFIRDAETLASPLRLTQEEACALLVGLEALAAVPGTGRAEALDAAISQVRRVAGGDAWLADAVALQLLSGAELETIAMLQGMIHDSQAARVSYLVRSRDEMTERTIEPRRIFSVDSTWYVRAWCRSADEMRSFRVDQLSNVAPAGPQAHAATPDPGRSGPLYTPRLGDREVLLAADPATARRLAPAYNATLHQLAGHPSTELVGLRIMVGEESTVPPLMARLSGHASVVHPEQLRRQVEGWLSAALGNYAVADRQAVGESAPPAPSQDG